MESSQSSKNVDKDHNYSRNTMLKCEICGFHFKTVFGLKEHQRRHRGIKEYCCFTCFKLFYSRSELLCHCVVNHGLETNYFCKICNIFCVTEDMYNQHVKTHKEQRLYSCLRCNKKYKNKRSYELHRLTHKKGKALYNCMMCYSPYSSYEFLSWVKQKNINDRNKCKLCGVQYVTKQELGSFFGEHAGHFPYKCLKCKKLFVTKIALKTHAAICFTRRIENNSVLVKGLINVYKSAESTKQFNNSTKSKKKVTRRGENSKKVKRNGKIKKSHKRINAKRRNGDAILKRAHKITKGKLVNNDSNFSKVTKVIKNSEIVDDITTDKKENDNTKSSEVTNVKLLNNDAIFSCHTNDDYTKCSENRNSESECELDDTNLRELKNAKSENDDTEWREKSKLVSRKEKRIKANKKKSITVRKKTVDLDLPFKCVECPSQYDNDRSLQLHRRKHHLAGVQNLICEYCAKNDFLSKVDFEDHVSIHKGEIKHKCNICNKVFDYGHRLKSHMENVHMEKKFQCFFCNKKYYYKLDLTKHLNTHTKQSEYKCNTCGKVFYILKYLKKHQKTHEPGYIPYYRRRTTVPVTYERKQVTCEICGKVCCHRYGYKNHMRTHTGEKPYKCEDCGEHFKQSSALRYHQKAKCSYRKIKGNVTRSNVMFENCQQ